MKALLIVWCVLALCSSAAETAGEDTEVYAAFYKRLSRTVAYEGEMSFADTLKFLDSLIKCSVVSRKNESWDRQLKFNESGMAGKILDHACKKVDADWIVARSAPNEKICIVIDSKDEIAKLRKLYPKAAEAVDAFRKSAEKE